MVPVLDERQSQEPCSESFEIGIAYQLLEIFGVIIAVVGPGWFHLALFRYCRSNVAVEHYELFRGIEMKPLEEFAGDEPVIRQIK